MRTDEEINSFLGELTTGYPTVRRRLDAILLRSLSEEELTRTRQKIKELTTELAKQEIELAEAIKVFESMTDTSLVRATTNRSSSTVNLFIEEDELDGIEIYGGGSSAQSDDEDEDEE
jgi:hypothetical protein